MISVIIPIYNHAFTLKQSAQSLIMQTYRPLEVIVADDASTDDSPAMVEALCKEYPDIVRLVRMKKNGGPSKARNEGGRRASGAYYFFSDSDTAMLPDALNNFIRRIAEADAVSGVYYWQPQNDNAGAWYKAMLNYHLFSRNGVCRYEVFNGFGAGIRAEVFNVSGGYNENLAWGMDYENEELGHRLFKDYKMLLDPSVAVRHAFPGIGYMTRTYFSRVALWMELFMRRRAFEQSGTADAGTGFATVAAPAALGSLLLVFIVPALWPAPLAFFLIYLYGYGGFLLFVLRKRPLFLPTAFVLNLYFSTVIAAGAALGALRVLTGRAQIREKDVIRP